MARGSHMRLGRFKKWHLVTRQWKVNWFGAETNPLPNGGGIQSIKENNSFFHWLRKKIHIFIFTGLKIWHQWVVLVKNVSAFFPSGSSDNVQHTQNVTHEK